VLVEVPLDALLVLELALLPEPPSEPPEPELVPAAELPVEPDPVLDPEPDPVADPEPEPEPEPELLSLRESVR
jgi:hypothetical protein